MGFTLKSRGVPATTPTRWPAAVSAPKRSSSEVLLRQAWLSGPTGLWRITTGFGVMAPLENQATGFPDAPNVNSSDPEDAWSINAVAVDVGVPAPGTDTGIDLELGVGNGQGSTPIQYTPPELKYGKSIQHLTYTNVGNLSLEDLNGTDSSWSSNVGDQYDLDRIVTLTVDDLPDDTEKVYVWAAIKYFNPLS